MQALTKSGRW